MNIILQGPHEIAEDLAHRVRALRLSRNWTQAELAQRAGLALATYQLFERTGQISLDRLLQLAIVLQAQDGFADLFKPPAFKSIAEIERAEAANQRVRARRKHAKD